jgi:LPS export ABC transporter protein LptC
MGVDARALEEKADTRSDEMKNWDERLYRLLLASLLLSVYCNRQTPVKDQTHPAREIPDQEGWNSIVTSTNKGRVEAVVHYGHMARFNISRLVKFDENVQVDFFDEAGKLRSVLTADTGELREASNDIAARGHVQVVSDTLTLWTEELRYEQATATIRSDVEVKFVTLDGDTLYGKGFESDSRLRNYRISNLSGIAHRRVDLSMEQLVKPVRRDSVQTRQP